MIADLLPVGEIAHNLPARNYPAISEVI